MRDYAFEVIDDDADGRKSDAGGHRPRVGLSTSCVYPEKTERAFELAAALGFDGVEVMVGIDPIAADIDAVADIQQRHQVDVMAIHAPTLLVTQRVWGAEPWAKLERSAEAANRLGAKIVVVHPPFRWQRGYGRHFERGIRRLNAETGVHFCVENMYPWRGPRGELKAYNPGWDPTELDYDWLTLDLSHASTARLQSVELAKTWGSRLKHVHLTDGQGSIKDEHLLPGRGDQHAAELLQYLSTSGYQGDVVLEVNTRKAGKRGREAELAQSLAFTRIHLAQGRGQE